MASYDFDWVDAFTDRAFGGNGCAVVLGAAHVDSQTCMDFVKETSLVECTFTGPSTVADFQVRYFLASREIPFAGHPTIATVASLAARGLIKGPTVHLETGAGIIPVFVHDNMFEMTQIAPRFGPFVDAELVAKAIGLEPSAIVSRPQMVSTGLPFCVTVLKDHHALRAARLDLDSLRNMVSSLGYDSDDMAEPFLVTTTGATPRGDTFSRLLLAPPSPPEDPFTGSATGAMAAYLWHHGMMAKDSFVAQQGHWLGRPGQAVVSRLGSNEEMTGVKVAGSGYILMSGSVNLPDRTG